MAGNSWTVGKSEDTVEIITDSGVESWDNRATKINTYFRTERTGKIQLAIRARVKSGKSIIKFQFGNETKELSISNIVFDTLNIGTFTIKNAGYQLLKISGVNKSSGSFAEISDLLISGEAVDDKTRYVKDEFYWGRRGPSVHLNYELPSDAGDVEWFYNEVTVTKGNDVEGSYFMANGFGEGYFGIQVNSPSERRILFSVWSPFKTDQPGEIPEDQKIILLKKGKDVNSGAFGNEGSGGQSYRRYYWKSGVTYRFLLKGVPSVNNSTDYTAYFFTPEIGHWELIASFRRPKTTTYLKRPHSFLENFIPQKGNISRMVHFSNQWVCNTSGKWVELNRARFTADATARKAARLDYSGGILKEGFFLKNCGFFNGNTEIDTWFLRAGSGKIPMVNFSDLP
ncbi:MAG TPA: DUF3472 domain-containing protein [Prolixibacteraceae bacterium]